MSAFPAPEKIYADAHGE